jgi:hypothetical protein
MGQKFEKVYFQTLHLCKDQRYFSFFFLQQIKSFKKKKKEKKRNEFENYTFQNVKGPVRPVQELPHFVNNSLISLCILRDLPQQKNPTVLCWGAPPILYVPMFL